VQAKDSGGFDRHIHASRYQPLLCSKSAKWSFGAVLGRKDSKMMRDLSFLRDVLR